MSAALLGCGHSVPSHVRRNDDPVFDWIRAHPAGGAELFDGYSERRVLSGQEAIEDHMADAASMALDQARVMPADIDILLGFTSVSPAVAPNSLALVHDQLGLRADCWVIPVGGDFSNFNAALLAADALVSGRRARRVLVACGANWSRHVSYRSPECVCVGDGAGAAVLGEAPSTPHWRLVDHAVLFPLAGYGGMSMCSDELPGEPVPGLVSPQVRTRSYFHITPEGAGQFRTFGMAQAPMPVLDLLSRHGLAPQDVTVVPHQASRVLLGAWQDAFGAVRMAETLARFGDMASANLPVNLSVAQAAVATEWMVLFGLGLEPHASALLLRRQGA